MNVIRRSITVDDDVNAFINKFRGGMLADYNREIDFTSFLNGLARLGIERLRSGGMTPSEWEIFNRYLSHYPELQTEARTDDWINTFMQAKLPKIMKQLFAVEQ